MFRKTRVMVEEKENNEDNTDRLEQLRRIQTEGYEIFRKKNQDYGDTFAKLGVIGVLVRLEDKIQRTLTIKKSGITLVDDEGLKDTLIDLHNYAAMALMLMEEDKK